MRVLVDLDGVTVDFCKGFIKLYNKKWDPPLPETPWTHFHAIDSFPQADPKVLKSIYHSEDFFVNLDPLPGAIKGINAMVACGIDVTICTSPSSLHSWSDKVEWVCKWLGSEWQDKLIITADKTVIMADYIIEDRTNILYIERAPWKLVTFDQSYNKHFKAYLRINWETWPLIMQDYYYHKGISDGRIVKSPFANVGTFSPDSSALR